MENFLRSTAAPGPRRVQVPEGIDPGFDYAPGATRLRSAIPPQRPDAPVPGAAPVGPDDRGLPNLRPRGPLPPPRPAPAGGLLPSGLAPEAYVNDFLQRFGATLEQPAIVADAIGERLVIGRALFAQDLDGLAPALERGIGPYLPLLAQALLEPDEIWVRLEWLLAQQRAVVRRRYVAHFVVDGQTEPVAVVFELGADGWTARVDGAEAWRTGARLYRREDGT